MSVRWPNATVLQLIDLYRSHRLLWDKSHFAHKNKQMKNDAWETISKILQQPRNEIESKIHTLRSQFMREKKKVALSNASECGENRASNTNWFGYKPMSFLLKDKSTVSAVNMAEEKAESDTNDTHQEFQTKNNIATIPNELTNEQETSLTEKKFSESEEFKREVLQNNKQSTSRRRCEQQKRRLRDSDVLEGDYRVTIITQKQQRLEDELEVYGQYVASELRSIKDELSLLSAKRHINNILIDARMGQYQKQFSEVPSKTRVYSK